MKDNGTAKTLFDNLTLEIRFEIATQADTSSLAVTNMEGVVTLAQLEVSVATGGSTSTWLYNKLLSGYSERIRGTVQQELQEAVAGNMAALEGRLSSALQDAQGVFSSDSLENEAASPM